MYKRSYKIIVLAICIISSALVGCGTGNLEDKDKIGNIDIPIIVENNVDSIEENDAALMANYLKDCSEKTRYGIYDIDNDGHMELFIAENDSHADSVTVLAVDRKNHVLSELGSFGCWGSMSYYPDGYVVSGFTGQGTDETTIYQIVDGTANVVHELWDNSGAVAEGCEYKVDNENVPETKYYEIYHQYTSGDSINVGYSKLKPIDDYDVMYNEILKDM